MRKVFVAVFMFLCVVNAVQAQFIVDMSKQAPLGRIETGGAVALSKIDYVSNDKYLGGSGSIDRFVVGGYAASGMSERSDIFGALGLIINAEGDGSGSSGTGFMLACGSRMDIMDVGVIDVFAYAQLELIFEDYGNGADGNLVEIALGLVAETAISDNVRAFAALDMFPFSDGSIDAGPFSADLERDSAFSLRIGGTIDLENVWLRGELAFIGETSIVIGVGTFL